MATQTLNLANLAPYQGFNINGTANSESGYSVSGVGDVNGDGYDDIIIGAPNANCGAGGTNCAGETYVIFGNASIPTTINLSLITTSGFSVSGAPSGSGSGAAVSGAGDMNGDGYDDIIIGAPFYSTGTGLVYILYGSSSLNNINLDSLSGNQGFSITGAHIHYNMGQSVSNIGDINSDGYDDIIIGAPYGYYTGGYYNGAGISYIIYGGNNLNIIYLANGLASNQGITIYGTVGYSGFSVSGVGDINGDGFNDTIIGAPYANNDVGYSYLIYGGTSLSSTIYLSNIAAYGAADSMSGFSVSGIGDINKDGFADLIISASYGDSIGVLESGGAAYVVYGGQSLNNINLANLTLTQGFNVSIAPISNVNGAGVYVSGAGDVNSDGYDDIIIGFSLANNSAGTSYVVYGGVSLSNINLNKLNSNEGFSILGSPASRSGYSVSGAGDINGDGYDDIIIGAPFTTPCESTTLSCTGAAYVLYGAASGFVTASPTLSPTTSFSPSTSPTYLPADISTSMPSISPSELPTAAPSITPTDIPSQEPTLSPSLGPTCTPSQMPTFIPSNDPTMTPTATPTVVPTTSPSKISTLIPTTIPSQEPTLLPSLNPTHIPTKEPSEIPSQTNILTSMPTINLTSLPTAASTIEPSMEPTIMPTTTTTKLPTIFLSFNPTVISSELSSITPTAVTTKEPVEEPTEKPTEELTALPTSLLTSTSPTYTPTLLPTAKNAVIQNLNLQFQGIYLTASGANYNDDLGYSVAGIGDINKDGYDDYIIASPYAANYAGVFYITYGNSFLTNIYFNNPQDSTSSYNGYSGANDYDQLGYSVSGAGDVNNDGYPDVIVGAPYANNSAGISYILYGSDTYNYMISSVYGAVTNDQSGSSVSGAGDVNGDGIDDIIIGAPGANNYAGISYIIHGNTNFPYDIALNSLTKEQGCIIYGDQNSGSGRVRSISW